MNRINIIFWICMAGLLVLPAAAQDYLGGGYTNPNFGQSYGRGTLDEGLAGMLDWLDRPVSRFPPDISDQSLYSQETTPGTFSPYSEYYTTAARATDGGIITTPMLYNISENTPAAVYFADGQGLAYSQYISTTPSRGSDLWIRGATNWTQHAVVPLGSWLELVAYAPLGGSAGFYQTVQTNNMGQDYGTYQLYPGYNNMSYNADVVGKHTLYFVVNNQPSNVVVIDVLSPEATPASSKPVHIVS